MIIKQSIVTAALLFSMDCLAQPGALPYGQLLDNPCAKTLPQGGIAAGLRIYPEGGLLASVMVGINDRFGIGVSYGGENIIGMGKANMNPQPAAQLQYLLLEEQFLSPALVIGFDSQGYLRYDKKLKRYMIKSKGIYAAGSKNTSFLGGIGIHAGINWSLENEDKDRNPDIFAGCHKWLTPEWLLIGEYDAELNDNKNNKVFSGEGLLNLGVRWFFTQNFFFEAAWKNLLGQGSYGNENAREVKLVYLSSR
jgi:hypothetical protein